MFITYVDLNDNHSTYFLNDFKIHQKFEIKFHFFFKYHCFILFLILFLKIWPKITTKVWIQWRSLDAKIYHFQAKFID